MSLTDAPSRPVVSLTGLWCTGVPGRDCGAPDNPVVPLAGPWFLSLVPLLGRWCSWQACGAPGKYVVSLGSSVVPLLSQWCP